MLGISISRLYGCSVFQGECLLSRQHSSLFPTPSCLWPVLPHLPQEQAWPRAQCDPLSFCWPCVAAGAPRGTHCPDMALSSCSLFSRNFSKPLSLFLSVLCNTRRLLNHWVSSKPEAILHPCLFASCSKALNLLYL